MALFVSSEFDLDDSSFVEFGGLFKAGHAAQAPCSADSGTLQQARQEDVHQEEVR